jgi:hypothetical protein
MTGNRTSTTASRAPASSTGTVAEACVKPRSEQPGSELLTRRPADPNAPIVLAPLRGANLRARRSITHRVIRIDVGYKLRQPREPDFCHPVPRKGLVGPARLSPLDHLPGKTPRTNLFRIRTYPKNRGAAAQHKAQPGTRWPSTRQLHRSKIILIAELHPDVAPPTEQL